MENLFGKNYKEIAKKYAVSATTTEILAAIGKAWDSEVAQMLMQDTQSQWNLINSPLIGMKILQPILNQYDNRDDIMICFDDFRRGLKEKLSLQLAAEKAEAEHLADEALKSDPRYKAVPTDMKQKFKAAMARSNRRNFWVVSLLYLAITIIIVIDAAVIWWILGEDITRFLTERFPGIMSRLK